VLLSLGVSGDGGIPLRLGVRDGNRSDSVETPLAIEEYLALGLEGMCGIGADGKAYSRRTLGVCLEHQVNVVTLGEHGEPGDDAASGLSSTSMAGCTRMAGLLRV